VTIAARDLFDRADSTTTLGTADTGQVWQVLAGTWGISAGRAYSAVATANGAAVIDCGNADGVYIVTLATKGTAPRIILRAIDASNYLFIDGAGALWKRSAGVNTKLRDGTTLPARLLAVVLDGPLVRLYDETLGGAGRDQWGRRRVLTEHRLTSADQAKYGPATRHGIGADSETNSRFDDFQVASVGATPAASSIVVTDSFNRPDALTLGTTDTGQPWAVASGLWGISANQAYERTVGADVIGVVTIDVGTRDGEVSARTFGAAFFLGIGARILDAYNGFFLVRQGSEIGLQRRLPGVFEGVGGPAFVLSSTDARLRLRLRGRRLSVYADDVHVHDHWMSDVEERLTRDATKVGMFVFDTAADQYASGRIDDFRFDGAPESITGTLPNLVLEAAWGVDAYADPTGKWTPITGVEVKRIDTRRGVRRRGRHADPGEAVLVVGDPDGRLDPGNTASPYSPNVRPKTWTRVKAQGRVILTGHVREFPVRWRSGDSDVQLQIDDGIRFLETATLPQSRYDRYVRKGAPASHRVASYWRFDDPSYSSTFPDSVGDADATMVNSAQTGLPLLPFDPAPSLVASIKSWPELLAVVVPPPPFTLLLWVRSRPSANTLFVVGGRNAGGVESGVRLRRIYNASTDNYSLLFDIRDSTDTISAAATWTAAETIEDDKPHLLALRHSGSTISIIVDGVFRASASTTLTPKKVSLPIGRVNSAGDTIEVGHVSMHFASIITSETIPYYTEAGFLDATTAAPGQLAGGPSSGVKMANLATVVGYAGPTDIDRGGPNTTFVRYDAAPVIEMARRAELVHDTLLFFTAGGVWTLPPRATNPPPVRWAYGIDAARISDLELSGGEEQLITAAVIPTETGGQKGYVDTVARSRLTEAELTTPDLPVSPSLAWTLAERFVHFGSRVASHPSEVELHPPHDGMTWDDALAPELTDIATVAYQQPWAAGPTTGRVEVVGIDHSGDAETGQWFTYLRGRPARGPRRRLHIPSSGTVGASTPDSAANSVTGDLDVRARWWQNDWAQAFGGLVHKGRANTASGAYEVYARAGGLEIAWHQADGVLKVATSPRMYARNGPQPIWGRVTLRVSDGAVDFYMSDDGADWRLLSSTSVGATSIRDTTAVLEVGGMSGGTLNPLNGKLLYAEVRSGIGGTVVARFDPGQAVDHAASQWTADTDEVWTVRTPDSYLELW
jgi:hypothetical protein